MIPTLPPYIMYLLAVVVSAVVSLYSVKKIIFIARKRKIYDIPDNIRKIHGAEIPSLGGIGVFIGYLAAASFFVSGTIPGWNYIVVSTVILFFTGIYDDIMNMRPSKKLLAQVIASALTVYLADIRIGSLNGLMGIYELPYYASLGLTIFCCTFFINVFNFIDGIDGLACMLAIVYCGVYGALSWYLGHSAEACLAFCLLGAMAGLLYYNYPPAKIYMGDTGSMLSGFSVFLVAVMFIRNFPAGGSYPPGGAFPLPDPLLMTLSVLFLPVFDALRVFALRLAKGISPLKADRRHLHYYLLDSGMSHAGVAWLLVGVNVLTIVIPLGLSRLHPMVLLMLMALPSGVVAAVAAVKRLKG